MSSDRRDLISDLYHGALARAPEDRAAFLVEACNGDLALREEVESLLACEPATARFLERPAVEAIGSGFGPGDVVGRQIGPYTIVAPLGAGGMGEVYRARDSKLGRDVAIKILPSHFTADSERRARFAREARTLATLNHPHIGAIYGLEEADGVSALVLELVEGQTLADRLERGALPIPQALAIARQIAEALEAAHEKGIVHRDLKPANVVLQGALDGLSTDVRAKVLDFGLAKPMAVDLAAGPTPPASGSFGGTADGRILGTPAYMSPEQARGLTVDKRTDIWAFGVVLFEMLSGRRPFDGATMTDTFVRVLEGEPDWTALPAATPHAVRKLLKRCLEKDPARRLRDIGDAAQDLVDDPAAESSSRVHEPDTIGLRSPWRFRVGSAALLTLAASVTVWLSWPASTAAPGAQPVMRLPVNLGQDVSLGPPSQSNPVLISPNGERLVFLSNGRLLTRRLDHEVSVPLAGTEGASQFMLSPDSQHVAFLVEGKLKRVALDGGPVMTIADVSANMRGGTWGEDGTIVIGSATDGLRHIGPRGGSPAPLTDRTPGEFTHRQPQFLPGAHAVIFTSHKLGEDFDRARIEVVSLPNGTRKMLQERAYFGRFVADPAGTGYVTFFRDGKMWAVAFDPVRLEFIGSPGPVLGDVAYNKFLGTAQVDASRVGHLVYRRESKVRLDWWEADGSGQPLLDEPGVYTFRASPDRRWVAYASPKTQARPAEVYVKALPDDGRKWPISVSGGDQPTWSQSDLLFRQGDLIIAVPYSADGSSITFGQQRVWSTRKLLPLGVISGYSVAPDGTYIPAFEQAVRSVTLWISGVSEFQRLIQR